jgi:hypothetical protein
MSREIMQQSLKLLIAYQDCTMDSYITNKCGLTIQALKQELAKPEPQVCCGDYEKCWKACTPRGRWLAEQEIVKPEAHIVKWSMRVDPNNFGEPLAKPEHEPVAWMVRDQVDGCRYPSALKNPAGSINGESQPLYTAPPRRPWVGLTDDEIWECQKPGLSDDVYKLIEAKLREKNT